ncbi:gamma-glutamylcyclotransferase family protein [Legionella bononiensis]|uniref:Gamma-glutamylcyclotransferase n=1 Tax=Legionella bononiensis TaxID=2793102 RepID=A0ABS1W7I1_9GAMM|nr:gamma-glutamylcyclotransferase family protein [Legionella bononiensis]MBL7480163.1 gamma-glutamylcyclotransferase [Legionella bononiensis]MBL7525322.1 gamma-glutamylcyclotransferase [Legionella bononiensis]MBL7561506.1 gamma-glutamylcyclotransferase [Legionella bononiensis]
MNCIKLIVGLLFFSLMVPIQAQKNLEETQCRPDPDFASPQYIIGYGSLMQEESKQDEGADVGKNLPVYLAGFERGWIEHSSDTRFGTTYLGVKSKSGARINAVVFQLNNPKDLLKYDSREDTYCRVSVPRNSIQSLISEELPQGQYWIYTTLARDAAPSSQYPLAQSYIDIFLSGCFELEKKYHLHQFAKECITKTTHWSGYWVNDRVYPRTAADNIPYARAIDSLIAETLPHYYNQIKIE